MNEDKPVLSAMEL